VLRAIEEGFESGSRLLGTVLHFSPTMKLRYFGMVDDDACRSVLHCQYTCVATRTLRGSRTGSPNGVKAMLR